MPFEITEELVRFLIDQNKKQSEQISELTAQVEALTQKIAELTEKNNKNSNNVSDQYPLKISYSLIRAI